jgi:Protein of unknown function (DUF3105)
MASRKEEKERRRAERLAAEAAAKAAAQRRQRLRLVGAVGLAVVALAAVGVAIAASGGKSHKAPKHSANVPALADANLTTAAKKAGCVLQNYPQNYGPNGSSQSDPNNLYTHVGGKVKYKTNPPAFGNHNPTPASDGDYVGQGTPQTEKLVHALEHGRVEIQYRPGLPARAISQLESVYKEQAGKFGPEQYELLFQNATHMPYDVAAVAWVHILGCKHYTPAALDAIRDFRAKYSFQGPEKQFVGPE